MTGRTDSALVWYDRAVEASPHDYHFTFYRASTLARLGRFEEARQAYIRTLVLNPRHKQSYGNLRAGGEELGVTLNPSLFSPRGVAIPDDEGIEIVVDEKGDAHWLMYAMAKAIWLGEPEHRMRMMGHTERKDWNSVEDVESIVVLLNTYRHGLDEKLLEHDPQLDLLDKIATDGYLAEFTIYEFGSRIIPQIVLLQPENVQQRMAEFVDRYVMPRNR
jgi:tetratricopeptide (TPR) repeat protein